MDIMELGAIGELVGGAAVLITLIYLALQVRQTNLNERAETHRAFIQQWNRAVHEPLLSAETSTVLRKVGRDFNGSPGDAQLVAHGYWTAIALLGQQAHILQSSGRIEPVLADAANRVVLRILKIPGAAQWWRQVKMDFVPAYLRHLERMDGDDLLPYTDTSPWFAVLDDEA